MFHYISSLAGGDLVSPGQQSSCRCFKNSAIVTSQSTQSHTVVSGTREILANFLFPLACLTHGHKTLIRRVVRGVRVPSEETRLVLHMPLGILKSIQSLGASSVGISSAWLACMCPRHRSPQGARKPSLPDRPSSWVPPPYAPCAVHV